MNLTPLLIDHIINNLIVIWLIVATITCIGINKYIPDIKRLVLHNYKFSDSAIEIVVYLICIMPVIGLSMTYYLVSKWFKK